MSENTTLNIDDYDIEDLKQIFSLNEDFTDEDINNSLISLLKKYSVLGEEKYIKFLKVARDKLLLYLQVENNEKDDNIDESDKEEQVNEMMNESTLYQSQYLEDIPKTNNIINRKNNVNISDEDKHFIYTRNREQVLQGHNLPVVQGQVNPVLRNVNKRIVSLDTQMRNYLDQDSNNVTMDLSEPLNNVLALRVLSVEIRHSWYTFDQAYGTTDLLIDNSLVEIPDGNYSEIELINKINYELSANSMSYIDFSYNNNTGKTTITNVDADTHTISFYDNSNPGNKKKNSNFGWLLGFRTFDSSFNIRYEIEQLGGNNVITSNSLLDVYGPKYILLELEDYNNNHFNRNFVAVDDNVESVNYPYYYSPDLSMSDPHYRAIIDENNQVQWINSGLTHAQAFTISQIYKSKQSSINQNKVSGMKTNDILSKLPVQYSKAFGTLIIGYNFINKNERLYYGPVNINRMKIALYNDAGQLLNLNGQDFAITLQTDELYQY